MRPSPMMHWASLYIPPPSPPDMEPYCTGFTGQVTLLNSPRPGHEMSLFSPPPPVLTPAAPKPTSGGYDPKRALRMLLEYFLFQILPLNM